MLLDPLVSGNHISDSQHRSIILAFLAQDKPKFALQYVQIRQPPQKDLTDIQLHVNSQLYNMSKAFLNFVMKMLTDIFADRCASGKRPCSRIISVFKTSLNSRGPKQFHSRANSSLLFFQ